MPLTAAQSAVLQQEQDNAIRRYIVDNHRNLEALSLSVEQLEMVRYVRQNGPCRLMDVTQHFGGTTPRTLARLLKLEQKGYISQGKAKRDQGDYCLYHYALKE